MTDGKIPEDSHISAHGPESSGNRRLAAALLLVSLVIIAFLIVSLRAQPDDNPFQPAAESPPPAEIDGEAPDMKPEDIQNPLMRGTGQEPTQ
jgi:hypothetical protein